MSFGVADGEAQAGSGASTSTASRPDLASLPGTRVVRARWNRARSRSSAATRVSDGGRVPVATTPTDRPVSAGETVGVVGIQVRQQHQREGVDAQLVQTPVHPGDLPACVDENRLPRAGRQDQGVALPTSHATRTVCAGGHP